VGVLFLYKAFALPKSNRDLKAGQVLMTIYAWIWVLMKKGYWLLKMRYKYVPMWIKANHGYSSLL